MCCVSLLQYDNVERGRDTMDREALQNIQEDFYRFIMREVIHEDGAYHEKTSDMASHLQLCNWKKLSRPAKKNMVCRVKTCSLVYVGTC